MLTFNPSQDGGTFEESPRQVTYECLIKMRENALWASETWFPISKKMATRYYRIMNRIEQAMLNYNNN